MYALLYIGRVLVFESIINSTIFKTDLFKLLIESLVF